MHCKIHEDGLCSACSKLAQIQLKIQQCKDLLDELYVQEARVKSCVDEAHDPIIRRLLSSWYHIFSRFVIRSKLRTSLLENFNSTSLPFPTHGEP